MTVYTTAHFRVRPEGMEVSQAAIRELVEQVKGNEPGTRLYLSLRDKADPAAFLHVMMFEDAAAEAFHRNTEWVKRFTGILYPHTEDGVQFSDCDGLAST